MNRLMALKQGNRTAEELVMEFRLLAGQARLGLKSHSDHIHMIGLFRKTLHPQLADTTGICICTDLRISSDYLGI